MFTIMPIAICNIIIHFVLLVISPVFYVLSLYVVEAEGDLLIGLLEDWFVVV